MLLSAAVLAMAISGSARGAVVTFTATGAFTSGDPANLGTPLSVSFAWETTTRPVPGTVSSPSGPQTGPVYASNPLVGPVTFTGNFGTLSFSPVAFSARFEPNQTRLFLDRTDPPFPGPFRIASLQLTLPFIADPYTTDLPGDLGGRTAFVSLLDPRLGTQINQATVTFAPAQAAVPEPATWAMMLGGFGLIGAAMRRRNEPATVRIG
jgi:hypothetical protein